MEFRLEQPIKTQINIDGKNDFIDLETIYLAAPTYKQKDLTIALKKGYFEALLSLSKDFNSSSQESDKAVDIDPKGIQMVFLMAKGFDLASYSKSFEKLLVEVAFKDESKTQKLNSLDIQKLDGEDLEKLMANYLAFFFVNSWMRILKA